MSYSQTAGCSLVNRPIIGVLGQLWALNLLQSWALPSTALGSSAPPSSTHCPGRSCQGSHGVLHIRKLRKDTCLEVLPCELSGNIGLLLKLDPPLPPHRFTDTLKVVSDSGPGVPSHIFAIYTSIVRGC